MLSRMRDYASKGHFREALIIGQNLFFRHSGDIQIFKAYSSVLESVMNAEVTGDGKTRYFQLLSSALTTFSESADMDDDTVAFVMFQEDRLSRLFEEIRQVKKKEYFESVKKKTLANDDILKKLPDAIEGLKKAADKAAFDSLLQKIRQYDSTIDKDYLTERQKALYDSATAQCSKLVDKKLRAFQRAADIAYNDRALEAYERAYRYFKTGEDTNNGEEIIAGLFGFDPARLFNETLTYYNQVYAYVLSKLNEKEKFVLTRTAIRSEMRR